MLRIMRRLSGMRSVSDVIEALGGSSILAGELGLPATTVASWKSRGSIPDEHRPTLIKIARKKAIRGVDYESLTLMHAARAENAA